KISRMEVLGAPRRGELPFAGFTQAEIDEMLAKLTELEKEPPPREPAQVQGASTVQALEDLVNKAISSVRAKLGDSWVNNREFGTRLHAALKDLVTESYPSRGGLIVATEQAMSTFGHVPAKVLAMTVEEFVEQTPGLRELRQELRPQFKKKDGTPQLIGALK